MLHFRTCAKGLSSFETESNTEEVLKHPPVCPANELPVLLGPRGAGAAGAAAGRGAAARQPAALPQGPLPLGSARGPDPQGCRCLSLFRGPAGKSKALRWKEQAPEGGCCSAFAGGEMAGEARWSFKGRPEAGRACADSTRSRGATVNLF